MYSKLIFTLFILGFSTHCISSVGARSEGLAHASTCMADGISIFNNPAGIAQLNHPVAGVYYRQTLNVPTLHFNELGAFYVHPNKVGSIGASFQRIGDMPLVEQHIGLSYAHQIRIVSLGLSARYISLAQEQWPTKHLYSIDIGSIAKIFPSFTMGFYMQNITNAMLKHDESYPIKLQFGCTYNPINHINLYATILKDLTQPLYYSIGLEYQLLKYVVCRIGYQTHRHFAGGFGLKFNKFQLDYAFSSERIMLHHSLNISYNFIKK